MVTMAQTDRKPLRLWPGVAVVILQWLLRFVVPVFWPDALEFSMLGAMVCAVAVVLWWVFFSRAPWLDRLGGIVLLAAAMAATKRILDPSIATGAMGFLFYMYALPVVSEGSHLIRWDVFRAYFGDFYGIAGKL